MDQKTIDKLLEEAYRRGESAVPYGKVATYIPELGKANPNDLGLSICTNEGHYFDKGLAKKRFTMQSISKVVTLALAIDVCGFDKVFSKVDMEPSGEAFNSLIDLNMATKKAMNPMINSGAITVSSLLADELSFSEITEYVRRMCLDPDITMNEEVFASEMANSSRNKAITYLLESNGILSSEPEKSLELYTRLCSLEVTAESLASLGMMLAMDGKNPFTGEVVLSRHAVEVTKTIMLTCGMYDRSGQCAVFIGMPSKSGVGGGLVSVADNRLGIGIYGPALDDKGNCIAGRPILEYLSSELKLHIFQKDSLPEILREATTCCQ